MRFIVNATFLINTIKTDINILDSVQLHTIQSVVQEVNIELGIDILSELKVELISTIKTDKQELKIPKTKLKLLSITDQKLLQTALAHRKNSILVTDDKALRAQAKALRIRCYTTPVIIALLIKYGKIPETTGIQFLEELSEIYIRPKDIETVLARIIKK
jgi:hypothetical protein